MLTITLLATLAAFQAQALPDNAAVVYSGIPGIVPGGSSAQAPVSPVRMVSSDVTFELTNATATVTSVTLFHNESAKPVSVNLKLPVVALNPVLGRGWDIDFKATLNGTPLKVGPLQSGMLVNFNSERHEAPAKVERYKVAPVVFGVKNTYGLKITYQVPMGKGGLDGMLRLIAYETAGASAWNGPLDRLNFTIHFGPSVVFHVSSAAPDWGWQIGDKGAFFKQDSFQPQGDTLVRFVFYPGGFDKIGTIGE
jgi:hypothetical protein